MTLTYRIARGVYLRPCALGATRHNDRGEPRAPPSPRGTLGEAAVGEEIFQGPLFAEWAFGRRMTLTRNELQIASHCTDISFALSLEASTAAGSMLSEMQELNQVPVDLVSDRFVCQTSIHAEFVAGVKRALTRIDTGSEVEGDLEHLFHRLAELYERMTVLDIRCAANAVPRGEATLYGVEHLLLGVVRRVTTWADYDVGRTSRSESAIKGFRIAHELVANMRIGADKFPEVPVFIAGLPLQMGVSMPPLITFPYFAESAQS